MIVGNNTSITVITLDFKSKSLELDVVFVPSNYTEHIFLKK